MERQNKAMSFSPPRNPWPPLKRERRRNPPRHLMQAAWWLDSLPSSPLMTLVEWEMENEPRNESQETPWQSQESSEEGELTRSYTPTLSDLDESSA